MTLRPLSVVSLALFVGCGGGSAALPGMRMPISDGPGMSILPDEVVSAALLQRLDDVYCEGDLCLDPFPLWAVSDIAVSDERIALAGPGALLSVFQDGAWTTHRAPVLPTDADPDRIALHVVAFSSDGERLWAGGSEGRVYELGSEGLSILHTLAPGEDGEPITISALEVGYRDEIVLLGASGDVVRLHEGAEQRLHVDLTLDRIVSTGRALREVLIVSGPFGGMVIEDAFGDAPVERPFSTDAHFAAMGDYSGCGPETYDERALEVAERTDALLDEGLTYEEAAARAERETPPFVRFLPEVEIPRSGLPAPELERLLSSTAEGRAMLSILRAPPTFGGAATLTARRDRSVAVASPTWFHGATLWARLGDRAWTSETGPLGSVVALDVLGDRLLAVGALGTLAALAPGSDALTHRAADPRLLGTTALRIVDNEHALIATERGRLLEVDLGTLEVHELAELGGAIRALAATPAEVYGVGDDGLVVRVREGTVSRIASGVSVDLFAIAVLGERRLVVGGDAGTIARLADGEPRVFDRITSERVVQLPMDDAGNVFGWTQSGVLLHGEGERMRARAGALGAYGGTGRLLLRVTPLLEGAPFVSRDTPLAVAVDTPDAIAPFGALLWLSGHDVFPAERRAPPSFLHDGLLEEAVFYWDGSACCDPDYPMSEGDALLYALSSGCDDDAGGDCGLLTSADLRHRFVSMSNGTSITVERGAQTCPDITVQVERLTSGAPRTVSSEVIACDDDLAAQQRALVERLGALGVDATWEPMFGSAEPPAEWGPAAGVGFFLRAGRGGVEIVRSDRGNRHATVLVRLPRVAMPSADAIVPLRVLAPTVEERVEGELVAFEADGFFWAGLPPRAMSAGEANEDDVDCARYEVRDADGHTTLRIGPTSRSDSVTTLPNGTEVHVARRERAWLAIDTPARGWLYERNVRCLE